MWRLWMCLGIAFALHGRALMEINITTTRASNIELGEEHFSFVCRMGLMAFYFNSSTLLRLGPSS